MSPTSGIWMASWVGAALFFFAGFLAARRRAAAANAPAVVPPPSVGVRTRAMRDRVTDPDELIAADRAQRARLESDVARLGVELAAAERRAHLAEKRAGDADRGAAAVAELERDRDVARAALETARRQLEAAEHAAPHEDERRERALQLEAVKHRAAEADALRDEVALLRLAAGETESLRAQLAELRCEAAELRSRGLARSAPRPPPPPPAHRASGHGTAHELEQIVAKLRSTPGFRSAVLADELGLPIVGVGDHVSSLAAVAACMDEVGRKATEFLPMGAIQRFQLEDANHNTLSACPLVEGDGTFVLVALTHGPAPALASMQQLVRRAAALF